MPFKRKHIHLTLHCFPTALQLCVFACVSVCFWAEFFWDKCTPPRGGAPFSTNLCLLPKPSDLLVGSSRCALEE